MRKHFWPVVVALAAIVVGGSSAAAQEAGSMVLVPSGAAVPWQNDPPGLPKGAQIAVLAGDPGKPGPFVLRVRFPPGTVVAPHRHAPAENLTVLSGDLYHGMGEKLDKAHGDWLQPGGFVFLPAMMPHSVWTAGAESVVQVTGTGPFGPLYVNPDADPSRPR